MRPTSSTSDTDGLLRGGAIGLAFLFSGAALLMHVLGRVPLRQGLLGTFLVAGAVLSVAFHLGDGGSRRRFKARVGIGAAAGLVALLVYDLAKALLALVDPSPFDPFGAIHTFGVLLAGATAPESIVLSAGIGYHVLNGVMFGVAFSVMFGHRGVFAGVLWGLFLEVFQSALYPGWLDVRFYREFLGISFLAHVVYGATLGYLCWRWLGKRRSRWHGRWTVDE